VNTLQPAVNFKLVCCSGGTYIIIIKYIYSWGICDWALTCTAPKYEYTAVLELFELIHKGSYKQISVWKTFKINLTCFA